MTGLLVLPYEVTLTWSPAPGASGYYGYRAIFAGDPFDPGTGLQNYIWMYDWSGGSFVDIGPLLPVGTEIHNVDVDDHGAVCWNSGFWRQNRLNQAYSMRNRLIAAARRGDAWPFEGAGCCSPDGTFSSWPPS